MPWFALILMLARPLRALELPSMQTSPAFSAGKAQYWRYEMVELSLDSKGAPFKPGSVQALEAVIRFEGREVQGIHGREHALLLWDPNRGMWRGKWPIPWNPRLGQYSAELLAPDPKAALHRLYGGPAGDWEVRNDPAAEPMARAAFTVRGKKAAELPPGFSVMTLEPGKSPYNAFPGVDGEKPSWFRILEWARFMHADALWHGAGQTQVWGRLKDSDFPWDQTHLKMARQLAGEAKIQGMGFGAYMITFMVEGDFEKTGYTFTTGYEHASDSLVNLRFVSMADPRRQRDLVALAREFDRMDGVSYIGFDYVRNDTGALEFIDEFIADMGYKLTDELKNGSLKDRQLWLGRLLALDTIVPLETEWDWWRAHKVAGIFKSMMDQARLSKPCFIFSLGWKRGHQHGQDPRMFIDAGVSFNSPMFYEVDTEQFGILMDDWKAYLSGQGGSFVFGQPVDTVLLHNSRGLNGPEEHYQRQVDTLGLLGPLADHVGFFWHDINRAFTGGRGPDSMREWAIAGAASFSRLRESAGTVPMRAEILDGTETPLGITFTVRVTNLTNTRLSLLRLDGVRVPGIDQYQPSSIDIPGLKPFEARELSWMAIKGQREVKERYKDSAPDLRMLALRCRMPNNAEWKRPSFAFRYVGSRGPAPAAASK